MSESTLSPEEAWYRLDQPWIAQDEVKAVICLAITKLPENVQDFAFDNCTFISVGKDDFGSMYPASLFTHQTNGGRRTARNHWVIVLNGRIATRKDGVFTVVHEIAHAWLKHQMFPEFFREEEADDLVRAWGFEIPKYRLKIHAQLRDLSRRTSEANALDDGALVPAAGKPAKKAGKKLNKKGGN